MKHERPAFFTGTLMGALVGAALAMVLAPLPGAGLRETLRAKANERSRNEDENSSGG
ncbi:MAG: hypothetical protein M3R44_00390 [Candidatus Eremiobacteraeota bacterium]|nr:hypothetical protein [Candidatus Eremiobacteraeota bacterium]